MLSPPKSNCIRTGSPWVNRIGGAGQAVFIRQSLGCCVCHTICLLPLSQVLSRPPLPIWVWVKIKSMFPFARATHFGYLFLTHRHMRRTQTQLATDGRVVSEGAKRTFQTPPSHFRPPENTPRHVFHGKACKEIEVGLEDFYLGNQFQAMATWRSGEALDCDWVTDL